ncbi:MAG: MerR family DNA-binding transcriptional regulator [Chloroflexota bacterium]|nr:MerR family DNA-binding transcriptional regulator [Chloroflexota bacterium]
MLVPNPLINDEERQLVMGVLPVVQRENPAAEKIIRRLVEAAGPDMTADDSSHVPITEVANAFSVTTQTIRNWADRGWLPSVRTPGGTRRIPRSVLDSAQALSRPRPPAPDLTPEQVEAIVNAPRRKK